MDKKQVLLWDFNGTLVDDWHIIHRAVCGVFEHYGAGEKCPSMREYISEYSGEYVQIYASRGIYASREELNSIFRRYYKEEMNKIALMEGAEDTLTTLGKAGVKMHLLTGQTEELVRPFFARFNIEKFFGEKHYDLSDKTSKAQEILERERIAGGQCYLIGDMPSDIEHAKRAGIRHVAFRGRHLPDNIFAELFARVSPHRTISHLSELPAIFGIEE